MTRLAPSPTGALHLGNLRTFLINAALAHQRGWRVVMRIEDIDSPRVKPESIERTLDTLSWIGLTWEPDIAVQSRDRERHAEAMRRLAGLGLVYPSDHTRADIEAASAPHEGDHEVRFPPELRPASTPGTFDEPTRAWRLRAEDRDIEVRDEFAGERTHNPHREVGDFVVWTKRDAASYQLAVVVDDIAQGVTHVVRGDDLIPSAARQQLLYEALGASVPAWIHVPLVLGPDGRRLAKRHGDTRVETYRAAGVPAESLIGLCAFWSGVTMAREPMGLAGFVDRFGLDTLPATPVTCSPEDHAWLLGTASRP